MFVWPVDKVGPGLKSLKVGDLVVISAPIGCGACDYCKRGQFSSCEVTNPSDMTEEMYGHRMGGICQHTNTWTALMCMGCAALRSSGVSAFRIAV